MFCPKCGTALPEGIAACPQCGAPAPSPRGAGQPESPAAGFIAPPAPQQTAAGSNRTRWIVVAVAVAAVLVMLGLYYALGKAPSSGDERLGGEQVAEATTTPVSAAEPSATPVVTPQPGPATSTPQPQPAPEPAVAVTRETGESPCYVADAYAKSGKMYVVVDYIQLIAPPDRPEEFNVVNENPKLRTFEITGDTWIGAFDVAGIVFDAYPDELASSQGGSQGYGIGQQLSWPQLLEFCDWQEAHAAEEWRSQWYIIVREGVVRSLVNPYRS